MVEGLAEVAVPDGGIDQKIHWPTEHRLESFEDAEIGVGVRPGRERLELHQEIEVAVGGVILTRRGGSEQLQPLDAVSTTQVSEGGGVLGKLGAQGGSSPDTIAQKGRARRATVRFSRPPAFRRMKTEIVAVIPDGFP